MLTDKIRNIKRLREILVILSKHGFYKLIIKSGSYTIRERLYLWISSSKSKNKTNKSYSQTIAIGLREAFEELGPTFVKLGQMLANRQDIFDNDFITETLILFHKTMIS